MSTRRRAQAQEWPDPAERARLAQMLAYERDLWGRGIALVAGVDEVGAGPWAGPVVAAAVILPAGASITDIDDSKRLSARQRQRLAAVIKGCALAHAIGHASCAEIDRVNILQAARRAMQRAVQALAVRPQHVLVDARRVPGIEIPQDALVHGDRLSQSIAAASILAKVFRDRLMERLGRRYPGYGFERHRGYGTPEHQAALLALGPSPVHRYSFAPVAARALSRPPRPRRLPAQGQRPTSWS